MSGVQTCALPIFENALEQQIRQNLSDPLLSESQTEAAKCLLEMIRHSEVSCLECSEEVPVNCHTLRYLWRGVRISPQENVPDFYLDLFHLFAQYEGMDMVGENTVHLSEQMARWPSGLDSDVRAVRRHNKERNIGLLIQDITGSGCHNKSR